MKVEGNLQSSICSFQFAILLLTCALARGQTLSVTTAVRAGTVTQQAGAGGGGGGPDAYYFSAAGTNAANVQTWGGDWFLGAAVTCTEAGTITKIGAKLDCWSASAAKLSLWRLNGGTWTYVDCGTVSITAIDTPQWYWLTLNTTWAVGAGETVRVFMVGQDANAKHLYGATTGGYSDTRTYANGCISTAPSPSDDYMFAVGVYVD